MQFCAEPGCGVLVSSGRCPAHVTVIERARFARPHDARMHRLYTSVRWRRLRLKVIQDEPFCRECRRGGRRSLTVDIDHIQKHNGDLVLFWDRRNLQGLCKSCHTVKTNRGE